MDRGGEGGPGAPIASLIEISRVLEETARIVRHHALEAGEADTAASAAANWVRTVRAIIAARRLRHDLLGAVGAEPAWSLVLEIYLARLDGRRIYQTRLAVAAGVPQTTALAVTGRLLESGTFTRHPDANDRRLVLIGLSDEAADRVRLYLEAALSLSPLVA